MRTDGQKFWDLVDYTTLGVLFYVFSRVFICLLEARLG